MAKDTFGDRLRSEREDRGLSIEAVAEILRVDHDRLRALERNDFDALPGDVVMVDCLHAYAECLRVDADLMIADYHRERDGWMRGLEEEAGRPAKAAETKRPSRLSPWVAAPVVVAIALLGTVWILSRDGAEPTPREPVVRVAAEPPEPESTPPADVAPTPAEPPADVAPTPAEPPASEAPADVAPTPAPRSAPAATAPSPLSINEYGVGTGVENRRLVGRNDRFTEGTRVSFWTRVLGASRGDRIDHVWLREGVEAVRVSLEIGGPSWRTHSAMTLRADAAGEWAVEARDAAGRMLARSEFVCVP